jgi:hypothetical protein
VTAHWIENDVRWFPGLTIANGFAKIHTLANRNQRAFAPLAGHGEKLKSCGGRNQAPAASQRLGDHVFHIRKQRPDIV